MNSEHQCEPHVPQGSPLAKRLAWSKHRLKLNVAVYAVALVAMADLLVALALPGWSFASLIQPGSGKTKFLESNFELSIFRDNRLEVTESWEVEVGKGAVFEGFDRKVAGVIVDTQALGSGRRVEPHYRVLNLWRAEYDPKTKEPQDYTHFMHAYFAGEDRTTVHLRQILSPREQQALLSRDPHNTAKHSFYRQLPAALYSIGMDYEIRDWAVANNGTISLELPLVIEPGFSALNVAVNFPDIYNEEFFKDTQSVGSAVAAEVIKWSKNNTPSTNENSSLSADSVIEKLPLKWTYNALTQQVLQRGRGLALRYKLAIDPAAVASASEALTLKITYPAALFEQAAKNNQLTTEPPISCRRFQCKEGGW